MPARTEAGPVEIAARNRRCVPSAAIGMLGGTVFALIVACSVYGCRARSSSPDRRADPAAAATAVVAGGPGSPSTGMQAAQDAPTPREPGPGEVIEQEADVSFDPERWVVSTLRPMERHPLSSLAEVQRRVGWADSEMDAAADDYDPTQESFEVAVPPSPMDPDGLLVWIPAAPSGAMPPELGPALEKCHVRYAGLNNAGNERPVAARMNLALDAVHAVCRRMPVRPDRIWVGGISGGAKTASRLALLYPEVFRGGLLVVGAEYFPPVPRRSNGQFWQVGIRVPATPALLRPLRSRRFVMVTGEHDFSREPVLDYHEAFKKDGLRNVLLLDIPGMYHGMPTPDLLEQALGFLDQ